MDNFEPKMDNFEPKNVCCAPKLYSFEPKWLISHPQKLFLRSLSICARAGDPLLPHLVRPCQPLNFENVITFEIEVFVLF